MSPWIATEIWSIAIRRGPVDSKPRVTASCATATRPRFSEQASGPADRSHMDRDQALQLRSAELSRAFARRLPARQNMPFCMPPTDRTEGLFQYRTADTRAHEPRRWTQRVIGVSPGAASAGCQALP